MDTERILFVVVVLTVVHVLRTLHCVSQLVVGFAIFTALSCCAVSDRR